MVKKPLPLRRWGTDMKRPAAAGREGIIALVERHGLGSVLGDKHKLSVLLSNLLSNSIKYQPTDPSHKPQLIIRQAALPEGTLLTVQDNGIGIKEEHLERIFAPFERLHGDSTYKGTGLGLSICKSIVEQHCGRIDMTSVPGKGTTFRVYLPPPSADMGTSKNAETSSANAAYSE